MESRQETVLATLANEPESVWVARSWAHSELVRWVSASVTERIEMILDELMANAVVHGEGEITVRLSRSSDHVEVSVADAGGGEVRIRRGAGGEPSGGLAHVGALATEWGVETLRRRMGKRVWATVAIGG